MTFRVVKLKGQIDLLRNPPDTKAFLSTEHWYNFDLMQRLINKGVLKTTRAYYIEDSSRVHHYEYWVQGLELNGTRFSIVVGTDDSGKLFVEQAMGIENTIKESWGKIRTRQLLFGFSYHWFEDFELSNIFIRVRLQGDLIASVAKATPDLISTYSITRTAHNNVVRHALRSHDPTLAVADDPLVERLDWFLGRFLGVKLFDTGKLKGKELEYFDAYVKKGERLRIRWGRFPRYHVLEFRGAQLDPRTFLIRNGRLKITHEEHGVNEINWGVDVIISL